MFIGSGALWGETILFSMCILEEMQWKRTRYITSADFFHGTLELVEPGVPVFLFMGEDENRKLDERVRAFLNRGVTGDTDINVIDTAEFAIPGLRRVPRHRVSVDPFLADHRSPCRLLRDGHQAQPQLPSLLSPVRLLRANNVCVIGPRSYMERGLAWVGE